VVVRGGPLVGRPAAVAFATEAFAALDLLTPPNRRGLRLGDTPHRIVNPLIMALIYFGSRRINAQLAPQRSAAPAARP
jgi:hypothetical protein